MKNGKTAGTLPVYVYNSVEDEWDYISGLKKASERKLRITLSNAYADSYLFANAGRKKFVFISPVAVPQEFLAYFESMTGSRAKVIIPKGNEPFISLNAARDAATLNRLVGLSTGFGGISIHPYATSPHTYTLKSALEKRGVKVALPESPAQKDFWTVPSYGSKSGFRELVASLSLRGNRIRLPEGMVFDSVEEALEATMQSLEQKGAVLLKVSKGSGGHGTYILKKDNPGHTRAFVKTILTADPLWKRNKIIVEEFIETDLRSRLRFPSIECYVDAKGKERILYCCNMLVTETGNFYGMEVGREAIPDKLKRNMYSIGRDITGVYAGNGYRGHFDIDMIRGKNGVLYVNESNVRNTGGTDAFKIAYHLLGRRLFDNSFLLSKFVDFPSAKRIPAFSEIRNALASILFSPATRTGVILSSQSSIKERSVTYFIIERTKRKAYLLEKKLLALVNPLFL